MQRWDPLRATLHNLDPKEHSFWAQCWRCGHRGKIDLARAKRMLPHWTPLRYIHLKLRCSICGIHDRDEEWESHSWWTNRWE